MLPIIFGGKIRKMLVDLLKMSKILVDFLSFFWKVSGIFCTKYRLGDTYKVGRVNDQLPNVFNCRRCRRIDLFRMETSNQIFCINLNPIRIDGIQWYQSVFGAKYSTDFSLKAEKIHQDFTHFQQIHQHFSNFSTEN